MAGAAAGRALAPQARISPTLVRRVLEEYPRAAGILHQALIKDLVSLSSGLERVRQQLLDIEESSKDRPARSPKAPEPP